MTGLGFDRRDYWRFLRNVYGMGALEAWKRIQEQGLPPSAQQIAAVVRAGI